MWQENEIKQLYEAIFHRKSVRAYAPEPLDKETLAQVLQLTSGLTAPLPGAPAAFRLLGSSQIKGGMAEKARHFLALYTGPGEEAVINASFMMQQLDLWFSAHGIGSCWMGIPRPVAEAKQADGLEFVILLVFGAPREPLRREQTGEFQRKPLAEITDTRGMEQLLEPVRLAPSAMNRQPWYITAEENKLRLHLKRDNLILRKALGNMPLVDMGIALCHLWLAAQAAGRFASLERELGPVAAPPGYRYMWTVNLKQ